MTPDTVRVRAGARVRTPEGWLGTARYDPRAQQEPHGGWRSPGAGLGVKRARPGELEAAAARAVVYVCVDLDRGGFANYNVETLEVVG
jgi:hypothetical protein